MIFMKGKDIAVRYAVATLGLVLVALGVALSLKSNLGTAPISCPPAMFNLRWGAVSVGTFTWMMHFVLILFQAALLGRKFKWSHLMQVPAAFVFGYLCDAWIWVLREVPVDGYAMQAAFCLATVVATAVGLRIEIIGNAWMIAGDKTIAVLAEVTGSKVSTVKVCFDIFMVVAAAVFGWSAFRNLLGDGASVIIREGTVVLALCTGLCMKLTDPLVDRVFKPLIHG